MYLTLADAASEYAKMRRLATRLTADGFDEDELWHPMWFPVTRAAYGGVLACDCSDPTSDRTPIRAIEWETEMFGDIGARSFGELVTWWIDALDARAWHYDRDEARWRYEPTLLDPGRELTRLV